VPRALGLLARTFLGLDGLLTVWCLGCCGFEPLVSAGNRAITEQCLDDSRMSSKADQAVAATPWVVAVAPASAPDCGCACQSCCAVSAVRLAFSAGSSEPQALPVSLPDSLISVTQDPRYPPPKPLPLWA
jgi:hypothetical protein